MCGAAANRRGLSVGVFDQRCLREARHLFGVGTLNHFSEPDHNLFVITFVILEGVCLIRCLSCRPWYTSVETHGCISEFVTCVGRIRFWRRGLAKASVQQGDGAWWNESYLRELKENNAICPAAQTVVGILDKSRHFAPFSYKVCISSFLASDISCLSLSTCWHNHAGACCCNLITPDIKLSPAVFFFVCVLIFCTGVCYRDSSGMVIRISDWFCMLHNLSLIGMKSATSVLPHSRLEWSVLQSFCWKCDCCTQCAWTGKKQIMTMSC